LVSALGLERAARCRAWPRMVWSVPVSRFPSHFRIGILEIDYLRSLFLT
jgi:hypothetical protein